MNDQGWFIGPDGELASWIPPCLRPCSRVGLDTKFVITRGIRIDIGSDVVHGREWQTILKR